MNSVNNTSDSGLKDMKSSYDTTFKVVDKTVSTGMNNMNSALRSGGAKATASAKQVATAIVEAFQSAVSRATSVGRYIGQGLAKTAVQSLQSVTGGKKGGFSSAATKVGSTYEKSLTAQMNTGLSKSKKQLNKAIKKNKSLKKALNAPYSQYSKYLKQNVDKATSATQDALKELGEAYQKKYEAFRDRLREYGNMFTVDDYGYVSLKSFDEMTGQIKMLGANLKRLKSWGVSQSFMEELAGMDTASALTMTNELLTRGKTAAIAYGKSYDKAMSTAASVSDQFYQSYFNADVTKALGTLQTELNVQSRRMIPIDNAPLALL